MWILEISSGCQCLYKGNFADWPTLLAMIQAVLSGTNGAPLPFLIEILPAGY